MGKFWDGVVVGFVADIVVGIGIIALGIVAGAATFSAAKMASGNVGYYYSNEPGGEGVAWQ